MPADQAVPNGKQALQAQDFGTLTEIDVPATRSVPPHGTDWCGRCRCAPKLTGA
jgi:hypothetical protein